MSLAVVSVRQTGQSNHLSLKQAETGSYRHIPRLRKRCTIAGEFGFQKQMHALDSLQDPTHEYEGGFSDVDVLLGATLEVEHRMHGPQRAFQWWKAELWQGAYLLRRYRASPWTFHFSVCIFIAQDISANTQTAAFQNLRSSKAGWSILQCNLGLRHLQQHDSKCIFRQLYSFEESKIESHVYPTRLGWHF